MKIEECITDLASTEVFAEEHSPSKWSTWKFKDEIPASIGVIYVRLIRETQILFQAFGELQTLFPVSHLQISVRVLVEIRNNPIIALQIAPILQAIFKVGPLVERILSYYICETDALKTLFAEAPHLWGQKPEERAFQLEYFFDRVHSCNFLPIAMKKIKREAGKCDTILEKSYHERPAIEQGAQPPHKKIKQN